MSVSELCRACTGGDKAAVVEILEKGEVDVNGVNDYDATPLYCAVVNNQVDIVKLLLKNKNTRLDILNSDGGSTFLYAACLFNTIQIIKELIDDSRYTSEVLNSPGGDKEPAIIEAARKGHFEAFKLLCDHPSIDLGVKDYRGKTLLQVVLYEKTGCRESEETEVYQHIAEYLVEALKKSDTTTEGFDD